MLASQRRAHWSASEGCSLHCLLASGAIGLTFTLVLERKEEFAFVDYIQLVWALNKELSSARIWHRW